MASELYVETLKGLTSGANANKVIVPAGQTLDASAGGFTTPAGHVIQVVSGSSTTETHVTSTTYTDANLSASITPTSTSSKILVIINVSCQAYRANDAGHYGGIRIVRNDGSDTTVTTVLSALGGLQGGVSSSAFRAIVPVSELDSPSSTNSITYRAQINVNSTSASDQMSAQWNNSKSTITLMEIAG